MKHMSMSYLYKVFHILMYVDMASFRCHFSYLMYAQLNDLLARHFEGEEKGKNITDLSLYIHVCMFTYVDLLVPNMKCTDAKYGCTQT